MKVKNALISVWDKTDLGLLLECLGEHDVRIFSSGGTAREIRNLGYSPNIVTEVSEYTGVPESPDGLLKTLTHKIHGGLVLNPGNPDHQKYMSSMGILPFDLVVVNLYPFQQVVKNTPSISPSEAVKYIDLGGVALIRSAAKGSLMNGRPLVLTRPHQYSQVIRMMHHNNGEVEGQLVASFAGMAFDVTSTYDAVIGNYFRRTARL